MSPLDPSAFEIVLDECFNDIRTIRNKYPLMIPRGELPETFREHAQSLRDIGFDILAQLKPVLQKSPHPSLRTQAAHFEQYLRSYYDACHQETYLGMLTALENDIDELRKAFKFVKLYL
jgi:hypothetical protein